MSQVQAQETQQFNFFLSEIFPDILENKLLARETEEYFLRMSQEVFQQVKNNTAQHDNYASLMALLEQAVLLRQYYRKKHECLSHHLSEAQACVEISEELYHMILNKVKLFVSAS